MRLSRLALLLALTATASLAFAQAGATAPTPPTATVTAFASGVVDYAGLIQAGDGNFYAAGNSGIYQVTPAGVVTQLHSFSGNCGAPVGIIEGGDGNFYGTCIEGGADSAGFIYQYSLTNGFTDIYDFPSGSNYGGPPTQAADGTYYGISSAYVYHMTVSGSTATVTNLATFTTSEAELQSGSLVQANNGNFYGYSFSGGTYEGDSCCGTFYEFNPSNNTITTLFAFYASEAGGYADAPLGNPAAAPDGVTFFTGTDGGGGDDYNSGALVSVNESGVEDTVYSGFDADTQEQPQGLFLGGDGNFYGVTSYGDIGSAGGNGTGTMFQLTPAGTFTSVYDFDSTTGSNPYGAMVQAADGNFYGGTGGGVIYKAVFSPAVLAPVVVTASSNSVPMGTSVTLTWGVNNATSETFSQCYAHSTDPGWSGLQATSGTQQVTPPAVGVYVYGLTCGGVESGYATVSATGPAASTTMLSALLNPVQLEEHEMFTVTVTPTAGNPTPTGTVNVTYSGRLVGSATLSSGVATIEYTVPNNTPLGTYAIVASYLGDSSNNPSASSPLSVKVVRAFSNTTLSASPNPVAQGTACTLTAGLGEENDAQFTGTVTFYYGSNVVGTAAADPSTSAAQFTMQTTDIPQGTYGITAKYSGDSIHQPSTSAALDVTVN